MQSRQQSRSHGASTIDLGASTPRAPRRSWWRTARRTIALFLGLVLVFYLLVAVWSLAHTWIAGGQISLGSDSVASGLGYPLTLAWTPSWLGAALGAILIFAFALSLPGMRRREAPQPSTSEQRSAETVDVISPVSEPLPAAQRVGSAVSVAATPALVPPPSPSIVPGAGSEPPTQSMARVGAGHTAHDLTQRVFISHSSADNAFGLELVRRLQQDLGTAVDVWYDASGQPESDYESGLLGGDAWWPRIVRELSERDVFVVLLSPEAMDSHWVRDEIDLAWKQRNARGPRRRKVIVPLLHRPCEIPETLSLVQVVSFLPPRRFEEALAELAGAIRLGATRMVEQPSVESGPPFDLAQLPVPAHFVGRQKELAFLRERLASHGSTTGIAAVNGMGGIGKTGLAAKVIRELRDEGRFPDGIAVALCQDKTTEADALQILADVLTRFEPQRKAPEATDAAALGDVADKLLRGKEALVVLDNVEPELPIAKVVTPLREAGATLLLTARQKQPPDVVPPEGRLALDLLSEDEALDLLAQSLGRPAALDLTRAELAAARRIVENLGRHTLAVTLAAGYVADEVGPTLEQLADQLHDPQRALRLPKGEAPAEVKRVFASSYAALPDGAKRLFAALGAFPTPDFSREAVLDLAFVPEIAGDERVWGSGDDARSDVEGTVELLVRRALVGAQGERLRLHPLMQAMAAATLAEEPSGVREAAERGVAQYYQSFVWSNAISYTALARDEANILGTIEWARAHHDDRLLTDLCYQMNLPFWRRTGRSPTALRYYPLAVEAAERVAEATGTPYDRETAVDMAAFYCEHLANVGRLVEAEALGVRALAASREIGDRLSEGRALQRLGMIAERRGTLDEAETDFQQALAIYRELQSRDAITALAWLGALAFDRGRLADAERHFVESLASYREAGDRYEEGLTLNNLGKVALARGRLAEAQAYLEESLGLMREVGNRAGEGLVLSNLGEVARESGRLDEAQANLEESLALRRDVGNRGGEGVTLTHLGVTMLRRGRLDEAQRFCEDSLAIAREIGDKRSEGAALDALGTIAQAQGRIEEAQRYLEQSLTIAREIGDRRAEGVTLYHLGLVALARGKLDHAETLQRESLAIGREVDNARNIADALAALGRLLVEHRHRFDEGRELLREAAGFYAEMGATADEQQTRAALRALEGD